MNRTTVYLCACCISFLAFASCASLKPIDEIKGVVDVEWELRPGSDQAPISLSSLKAGEKYFVAVRYLQEKKSGKMEWKALSNTEGISLSVDGSDYSGVMPWLSAPTDPFLIFGDSVTQVTVNFPKSIGKNVSKDVSLALPEAFPSFRGVNGKSGEDGGSWGNGPDGTDGADGTDGRSVDLELARYNTKGTSLERLNPLVLASDSKTGRVWVFSAGNALLSIDSSGGSGGHGGKGADQTLPEDSGDGDSIKGGNGGDAGDGGSGGIVHVILPAGSALGSSLRVSVEGGKGGNGGDGGEGETNDDVDNFIDLLGAVIGLTDGKDGKDGADGIDGRYYSETREIETMFLNVSSPLFDRARLEP